MVWVLCQLDKNGGVECNFPFLHHKLPLQLTWTAQKEPFLFGKETHAFLPQRIIFLKVGLFQHVSTFPRYQLFMRKLYNNFGLLIAASIVSSGTSATAVVRTTRTFISFSVLSLLFAAKLRQAKLNLDALRERVQAPAFGRGSNLTVG